MMRLQQYEINKSTAIDCHKRPLKLITRRAKIGLGSRRRRRR
jgi:hypothetical protein